MNRAIILSRVSTQHQDLTQQTDEVLREVHKDGFSDDNIIIIEEKESAIKLSEEERRGLNRMKYEIGEDPNINCVYIYELSRLSRRQLVLFSIRDYLVERKIQLICLKPYFRLLESDGKMSQTGSLMFSLFSSLSESEMMLKQERMMRGRKRNLALGKSAGGRPAFGYLTDKDKKYVIHKEQADLLRRIFKEYAYESMTIKDIATNLKEEGYFPDTSLKTLILRITNYLKCRLYIGEGAYPQIITPKLFEDAQKSLTNNRTIHKLNHKEQFLLKGLVCDAHTGYILSGNSSLDSYFSKHCSGVAIRRVNIDPIVWEFSKKMYSQYLMNRSILQKQIDKEIATTRKKLHTIEQEMNTIQSRIDKIEERLIMGRISEAKADELNHQLQEDLQIKDKRHCELVNYLLAKQYQIQEAMLAEEINETTMSLQEKVDIVRKVVDIITVEKPSVSKSIIKIYNRINDRVHIYEVDCWKHTWGLIRETTSKEVPHIKLKSKHIKVKPY
ncbi:MAG: recombinase family protein [Rikenellaceae bacterium]|nr:recombinase family protein [Rikenellaceae bacterium]MBQ6572479.1 recombinase family protein [Alistipes sp.]